MKLKSLIIIFLVALLGASIGTLGILGLTNSNSLKTNPPITINQVKYDSIKNNDYAKALEKCYDTVVEITTKTKVESYFYFGTSESTGSGSGVIISSDGYIVTNHHVVDGANEIKVKLTSGESFDARIIGLDSRTDLALIKIDVNNLKYANFVDSDDLVIGQEVIAVGNPLGEGITASTGIISSLEKEIYLNNVYMDLIQTDASINEGNSGGGLFDLDGNIVAIVNAKSSNGVNASVEGMGYAIPSNRAIKIISELKDYGYVKDRATLGIKVGSYSYSSYLYQSTNGLLITEVIENGGAYKAGIKENDLIIEIDGTSINSYAALNKALEKYEVNDTVEVIILRGQEKLKFNVTLTEAWN